MAPTALDSRDPARAMAAHLVRRTSLGVEGARVEQLADLDWDDAVADVLGRVEADERAGGQAPDGQDWTDTTDWWIDRMTEPGTGLVDRLAWFWHGLLTTNAYKVSDNGLLATQLDHFRVNGSGDFRTLLHGFITGGALLEYLDASHSLASNPNENLARELMELFTVGRRHYTEDDVRAGARALAGWVVDDGRVEFRRENAFIAPLIYLGRQADWDTTMVVDELCDHPATAARISARMWRHFVGPPLTDEGAAELGRWWQAQDLEIMPLVERILTDPTFAESRLSRPRGGLEWYCAARSALRFESETWYLETLNQMPYLPPSVAGWPDDLRWLGPGSLLARASFTHSVDIGSVLQDGRGRDGPESATTEQILDRCSLYEVSAETVDAIEQVATIPDISPENIELVRWRLALTSPEFNLL
ncbi:MAG: DUF1800 family protein [Acidimicrobiales bacterium]